MTRPGASWSRTLVALPLALALAAGLARAQTMLDQEERLVELHSLLVALPATTAPGALAPWQPSLGVELVGIPEIDGTTGPRRQLTASDRTRAFPRPRLALGLPVGGSLRAFAGVAYIPPVALNDVSSHLAAAEAGMAFAPGPLAVGLRGQVVRATSRSPVTDPRRRDVLRTTVVGADLSAGWSLEAGPTRLTPYASVGLVRLSGRFTVTSDGAVIAAAATRPALGLGLRLLGWRRVEAGVELVEYPGRLRHVTARLAWAPAPRAGRP